MSGRRPSLPKALVVLVVVGGLILWWVNAIPNEDPLWFLRTFNARADWITVYWDGETRMCFPGDPEYEALMDSFAAAVAHRTGYEGDVGLSEENLQSCRTEQRLLEFHFNEAARVHTRHPFPEARIFWVPLSGTHAEQPRVFSGLTDQPRIGALNVSAGRLATLVDAAKSAVELHGQ